MYKKEQKKICYYEQVNDLNRVIDLCFQLSLLNHIGATFDFGVILGQRHHKKKNESVRKKRLLYRFF